MFITSSILCSQVQFENVATNVGINITGPQDLKLGGVSFYDFDNDGYVTPEDIRIMMSYMPFNRHVQIQNVQSMIETRGIDNLNGSPNRRQKQSEGLYQDAEGKNINYNDRIHD